VKDDLDRELAEMKKMGCVSSSDWQSYTWKNELAKQKLRIGLHLEEALSDAETEHNPYHMLERAIGVASVCMRRLLECRLVTDRFRGSQLDVHEIHAKANTEWREPFVSRMASDVFNNYDLKARHPRRRTPKVISDKMLHACHWRAVGKCISARRPANRVGHAEQDQPVSLHTVRDRGNLRQLSE